MATQDIVNNQRIAKAVNKFSLYSDEILSFVNNIDSNSTLSAESESEAINGILNGRTTLALDRLVPLAVRKEAGIFFTGTTLSDKVAEQLIPLLHKGVKVCDPANGAGNLLIA